jgi:hypothetical protein
VYQCPKSVYNCLVYKMWRPWRGCNKTLFSMYSVSWFGFAIFLCGGSMYLFLGKGSWSLAGFGCVLVVGSSDQRHFSGMALGDTL